MRTAIHTHEAPPPVGAYSQAIACLGKLVFISGQTPRRVDGTRLTDEPFAEKVDRTLRNVDAVARASGLTLAHAAKVTVYLRDMTRAAEFDRIYRGFVGVPYPARAIVQSSFIDFDIEIDAILDASSQQGSI